MPVKPIPEGYPVVIPYLMVRRAAKFIGFMQAVFGAECIELMLQPDGSIGHTELRIGDSMLMLYDAGAVRPVTR
jgi:PhnB protein